MQQSHLAANPFALLLNPEAVHAALQSSANLNNLKSTVWRPLDSPLIPRTSGDVADFDSSVDSAQETDTSES
jgi:hypothetical protein